MPARQAKREPAPAAPGPDEREVRAHDPMPKGYTFVPKGDVYITKNCRKTTHETKKTLFVVVDKKSKPMGLRCPTNIYNTVVSLGKATATQRAEAVQKRDAAIVEDFEEAIVKLFPTMPKAEVQQVLKHSLKKHSRRVGRTNKMALQDRVKLAVRAHIRHMHTDYDKLLKQGVSRLLAREKIWDRLNEIARQWGGRPLKPAAAAPAKERRAKMSKTATFSSRGRTKGNGGVKKAVVHAARVLTRRMSKEAFEMSPHRLREARSVLRESVDVSIRVRTRQMAGGLRVPADADVIIIDDDDEEKLAEDVNGLVEDVDMQDVVFATDEDTSDYDSDGSEWGNWSDVGAGGGKGRRNKK